MRHNLLVVSEKKIKMLKPCFVIAQNESITGGTLDFKHVHNIRANSGALCW